MTRALVTIGLVLLFVFPVAAQQTGLTEAQLKAAEIEVPQLVELLELKSGMTVADVGAGFGACTMRLSKSIGPAGRVYATDVGAVLTHVRTISNWAPNSQPSSLYLVLFRKP